MGKKPFFAVRLALGMALMAYAFMSDSNLIQFFSANSQIRVLVLGF